MYMREKRVRLPAWCLVGVSVLLMSGCLGSEDGKGSDNGCGFIESLVFGCNEYGSDTGWSPYWDTGYDLHPNETP
jgi:hypothetical protein